MKFRLNDVKMALARAEAFAARHPRALTGGVVTVLSGFAITAFGIAPLAPNAADLPQRTLTEQIQIDDLDAPLSALASHSVTLSRN